MYIFFSQCLVTTKRTEALKEIGHFEQERQKQLRVETGPQIL